MKDRRNMLQRSFALLLVPIMLACVHGQASGQPGERFSIGISERSPDLKLKAGSLVSSDKKLFVMEPSSWQSFGRTNGMQIPEEIEFMWRIDGQLPQLARIKVRSQIPAGVLQELSTDQRNAMDLRFFVRDGKPSFRWKLDRIEPGGGGPVLSRGGDWSR